MAMKGRKPRAQRFCEMCEAWTSKRICAKCGADTMKAEKERKHG